LLALPSVNLLSLVHNYQKAHNPKLPQNYKTKRPSQREENYRLARRHNEQRKAKGINHVTNRMTDQKH